MMLRRFQFLRPARRMMPALRILVLTLPFLGGAAAVAQDAAQIASYRDYAVIRTSCETWNEAYEVTNAITARGGVVSVILSPQYLLGWVPADRRSAIEGVARVSEVQTTISLRKPSLTGPDAETVQLGLDHFTRAKAGALTRESDLGTAAEPLTGCFSDRDANTIERFGALIGSKLDSVERAHGGIDQPERDGLKNAIQSLIPAGVMTGIQNVDVFLLESTGSASIHDWSYTDETRVMADFLRGFDFWSRHAARYGRSVTFRAHWYRPSSTSLVNVPWEPVRVADESDWQIVRQVMLNLEFNKPWGSPVLGGIGAFFTGGLCIPCDLAVVFALYTEGTDKEFIRLMKWNSDRASEFHVQQSFCAFVKYHPRGSTDPIFRAYARVIGTGWIGGSITIPVVNITIPIDVTIGTYIMVDARDDRFPAVVSHETGHIFGAPDEYRERDGDADCPQPGDALRGQRNVNCFATSMNSVTGMMRDNSISNLDHDQTSSATPVFIGWASAPARTIRFRTNPTGIPMNLPIGIRGGNTFSAQKDLYLAPGYTIDSASVPASYSVGPTQYYFEEWLENGVHVTGGPVRSFLINSTVNEYTARYTTTGAGIAVANATLVARLGVGNPTGTPRQQYAPAVVLVWRSTLTSGTASYVVQYWNGSAFVDAPSAWLVSNPAGQYCYAQVTYTNAQIAAGSTYRFRVVPIYQGSYGTPSNEVSITTRAGTYNYETYCYDWFEDDDVAARGTTVECSPANRLVNTSGALPYRTGGEFGYAFDEDHYHLQAVVPHDSVIRVALTVRPGSDFVPVMQVRNTGTGAMSVTRPQPDGSYLCVLYATGIYDVAIVPQHTGNDLISESTGRGCWGEYSVQFSLTQSASSISGCAGCVAVTRQAVGHGLIIPVLPAAVLGRVFQRDGHPVPNPAPIALIAEPGPGYRFSQWEGALTGNTSPRSLTIPALTEGSAEYQVIARFDPLPAGQYELVVEIPQAYQSILGPTKRYRGQTGDEFNVSLADAAFNGFIFDGWDGDLTPQDVVSPADWLTSAAIRVKLTRNLYVHPLLRPNPCAGGGALAAFQQNLTITAASKQTATLTFGMQPGAGDGLESGQQELPPIPVSGVFDARLTSIPGCVGSFTDIRAVKPMFVFNGWAQPGDQGDPLTLTWPAIPETQTGSYTLLFEGESPVNMRSQTMYRVLAGGPTSFTVTVASDTCRELPKDAVTVQVSDVNTEDFPYFRGRLCVQDKDGNPLLDLRRADIRVLEQLASGAHRPAYLMEFDQASDCYSFGGLVNDDQPPDSAHSRRTIIVEVGTATPPGQAGQVLVLQLPVIPNTGDSTGGNNAPDPAYQFPHGSGWQLVSLPVKTANPSLRAVFPDTTVVPPLFAYSAGYQAASQFDLGRGYWLRFRAAGSSAPLNALICRDLVFSTAGGGSAVPLARGWNLVGSISVDLPVAAIISNPANAIASIFEFDQGYKAATVITPGKGYWLKLASDASIEFFRSQWLTGGTEHRMQGTPHGELLAGLPHERDWLLRDAAGGNAALFTIARDVDDRLTTGDREIAGLPPRPPSEAFDARFENGTLFTGASDAIVLTIQGAFPMDLATPPLAGSMALFRVEDGNGVVLGTLPGNADGAVRIPAPVDGGTRMTLLLRRSGEDRAPASCALEQNYPNPLVRDGAATRTVIGYGIAEAGHVDIAVTDMLGRRVRLLRSGDQAAGRYRVVWDGCDDAGVPVSAGLYCYSLVTRSAYITRRLTVLH